MDLEERLNKSAREQQEKKKKQQIEDEETMTYAEWPLGVYMNEQKGVFDSSVGSSSFHTDESIFNKQAIFRTDK